MAIIILKVVILSSLSLLIRGSIDGKSYMDSIAMRTFKNKPLPGEDPCNPLYWYPKNIPEYCYYRVNNKPNLKPPLQIPLPVPLPIVPPMPLPMPILPPLPYGVPIAPSNPMIPMVPNPYVPFSRPLYPEMPQAAMVPGISGLVSRDGGINILPFSDIYSDMLEKHNNKLIRRKLEKLLEEFDEYPNRKIYNRLKKYREELY